MLKLTKTNLITKASFAMLLGLLFSTVFVSASANDLSAAGLSSSFVPKAIFKQEESRVDRLCHRIARKLGSVKLADCLGNGFTESGGESVEGLPILVKSYLPKKDKKPLSRILLIGGIHGDEYSSVSIVFKWINKLDKYHSGLFEWRVVPLMNPDGLLRKKSQRMNSRGVDLNRNFPTPNWEKESDHYWVKRTSRNPRRYPGPSPLSEPESKWLVDYISEYKPDIIVSVHAPYGILDFDGPKHPPKKLGHLHLNVLGTYPGSLGNYAGVQNDIPVVTIELPYAGIMPTKGQIKHIWIDLIQWLKRNSIEPAPVKTQQVRKDAPLQVANPS